MVLKEKRIVLNSAHTAEQNIKLNKHKVLKLGTKCTLFYFTLTGISFMSEILMCFKFNIPFEILLNDPF